MADDVLPSVDPVEDPTVKVILDIATNVLLRSTVDVDPSYNPDKEYILEIPKSEHPFIDGSPLQGTFVQYDAKTAAFEPADPQAAIDAGVDKEGVALKYEFLRKQLAAKRQAILDDGSVPQSIKDYFENQRQIEEIRGL